MLPTPFTRKVIKPTSLPPDPTWIQFTPHWESPVPVETQCGATPPNTPHSDKTVTIVMAEDDPVARELIFRIVNKWGFRTIVAQEGHEAMAAIRAEPGPVIAILDG